MDRITAAVIFGGQSSEHEVSCMSAANIIEQIDRQIYDLLLIGITKEGRWLKVDSQLEREPYRSCDFTRCPPPVRDGDRTGGAGIFPPH